MNRRWWVAEMDPADAVPPREQQFSVWLAKLRIASSSMRYFAVSVAIRGFSPRYRRKRCRHTSALRPKCEFLPREGVGPLRAHEFVPCNEGLFAHVDLQWFAAEDEGRTEDPTEQKIRKAREEGKVAKSQELSGAVVLLFPVIMVGIMAPYILRSLIEMMRFFLLMSPEIDIAYEPRLVAAFFTYFFRVTAPIAAVAFVSALLGNLLQVGFMFATKPITPDFSRIVPRFGRFFKRAFFSGEAAFNLAKSLVKIVVIGLIAFLNIASEMETIGSLVTTPFLLAFRTIMTIAFRILVQAAVALLVLSVPDYLFQRRQHKESLKMTRQEVKEERRMSEGDPLVRSRLRERMKELLSRNMMQSVPRADVVVTNPTHFAVAMEWERRRMDAPMVVAKGQDNLAFRIRKIAEEHSVPVVENKPLARALYAEVEIGDVIPEKYYEVLAVILAEIYRVNGRVEKVV